MKWAKIGKAYFNTALITAFYWSAGRLCIHWVGEGEGGPDIYTDVNREQYLRLCRCVGVAPVEEDDGDGKSRI